MSKPLGLTPARRRALEDRSRDWPQDEFLRSAGLIDGLIGARTPRGHAALAAPKMTQAEYDLLCASERGELGRETFPSGEQWRTFDRMCERGYINRYKAWELTPSGHKALNDVRAAIGSAEWKP